MIEPIEASIGSGGSMRDLHTRTILTMPVDASEAGRRVTAMVRPRQRST